MSNKTHEVKFKIDFSDVLRQQNLALQEHVSLQTEMYQGLIRRLTELMDQNAEYTIIVSQHRKIEELQSSVDRLTIALADAIRRPMGVVPTSAEEFINGADLEAAEARRVAHSDQTFHGWLERKTESISRKDADG